MKALLFVTFLASCMFASSGEPEIGVIVSVKDLPPKISDITVSYEYDGKERLILYIQNIEMNAAARGVIGSVVLDASTIILKPKELYDIKGPVESIRWYSIRYVIPNIPPGHYSLVHDDTATQGQDRVTKTNLDLTAAIKSTVKVTFNLTDPSEDPFAESSEIKKPNKPKLSNSR